MAGSDFSCPYISGDGSSPSRCGPRSHCVIGRTRDLPAPVQKASAHARVSDHAEPSGHSRSRARPCCLPRSETRRHPGLDFFRGSMAGLCAPLPTLRRHPCGCQRTAWGRGGSLRLPRGGLAPPTPCRSPGALRLSPSYYTSAHGLDPWGHVTRCENCAQTVIAYNSCRNRHCPKCQGAAAKEWLAEREAELLPVGYFHLVFT